MTDFLDIIHGDGPLILSIPHAGTELAPGLMERLTPVGQALGDTDWHVPRLYDFAAALGASVIATRLARVVIDVNRDPSGASLYPGQATTELVPVTSFDGDALYRDGQAPDAADIAARKDAYFAPFHAALSELIARARRRHGLALLYDGHSIRSVVPRLFDGELPVLNIGTNTGASLNADLRARIIGVAEESSHEMVVDGRFKGGWITRHYGNPAGHVHAVQMEIAQRAYMLEAPPWTYDEAKAGKLKPVLQAIFEAMIAWAWDMKRRM